MKLQLALLTLTCLSFGCGGGKSPADPADASASGADAGTHNDAGASMPDAGNAAAPSCADYCAAIQANCMGQDQQYESAANCLATCAAMDPGAAADRMGNTLGCRAYHAGAAAGNPAVHCPHAGPGGGGVCGNNCDSFCALSLAICTGANQVYTDTADCMTECSTVPDTVRYTTAATNPGSAACFVWYIQHDSVDPRDCLANLSHTTVLCD
ncbi:MAG: hypothetical protein U1E65_11890 [Myxococcota bacterium]